jgi:hypothetical protein
LSAMAVPFGGSVVALFCVSPQPAVFIGQSAKESVIDVEKVDVVEESSDLEKTGTEEEEVVEAKTEEPGAEPDEDEELPEGLTEKASERFQRLANESREGKKLREFLETNGFEWNGSELVAKGGVTDPEPEQEEAPKSTQLAADPDWHSMEYVSPEEDDPDNPRSIATDESWIKEAVRQGVKHPERLGYDGWEIVKRTNASDIANYNKAESEAFAKGNKWFESDPILNADKELAKVVNLAAAAALRNGATYQTLLETDKRTGDTFLDLIKYQEIGRRSVKGESKEKAETERVKSVNNGQPGDLKSAPSGQKAVVTSEIAAYASKTGLDPERVAQKLAEMRKAEQSK